MIPLGSQGWVWMMMVFGIDPRALSTSLFTNPEILWDHLKRPVALVCTYPDVWASLLDHREPRIFPPWLLFLSWASAGMRDDKISCAWACDEWLCLQTFSPFSVTTIPVPHSMTRGSSDTKHMQMWEGKGLSPGFSRGKKKSTEPSVLAVVNIELFRLEKVL